MSMMQKLPLETENFVLVSIFFYLFMINLIKNINLDNEIMLETNVKTANLNFCILARLQSNAFVFLDKNLSDKTNCGTFLSTM